MVHNHYSDAGEKKKIKEGILEFSTLYFTDVFFLRYLHSHN